MDKKRKIIIIEDEINFAKMVKLRLESEGYDVQIAGDAYQGTKMVIQDTYDLIILDLMMPAGGGFSLLERISKLPMKATIPVIILTGSQIDDKTKAKAQEYNVRAIFAKPYNSAEFTNKIKSIIPNE